MFTNDQQCASHVLSRTFNSVHCKHIKTLLTKIYKTFFQENPYFMDKNFAKEKDVRYSFRTSNLCFLSKMDTNR